MPGTSLHEIAHSDAIAPGPLLPALRQALRDRRGRVVLRVEESAPHRRRIARALLQEGALAAGGRVLEAPDGALLLVGAEAGRAERLKRLVDRLVGPAASRAWSLDRDAEALLAYAAGGPAPVATAPAGPSLAGLDAFLDALPLAGVVRRLAGWAPGGTRPDFLRLEPAAEALAAALGPLGTDADLLEHAAGRVALRLLSALGDPAEALRLLGPAPPPVLHLRLPRPHRAAVGAPRGRLVAMLPLAEAANPAALASRLAALEAAGIGAELDGLDAAALGLLAVEALPALPLRLRWSPALAGPGPRAALRSLSPERLVLAGAPPAEAMGISTALGIGRAELPA